MREARTLDEPIIATSPVMFQPKPSGGAAAVHGRGVGQLRRIPKTSLNHAPDAMHGAWAAGLSARLKLLGDLLQKLKAATPDRSVRRASLKPSSRRRSVAAAWAGGSKCEGRH
jgi:hypothetical protein